MDNFQLNYTPFTGIVDSSVRKYVTALKKESKQIYKKNCKDSGIQVNPTAFKVIDERCNTALNKINQKADLLHKDTVIKAVKNPNKKDGGLYLIAENKGLLREWEQKGVLDTLSVYRNNLRETRDIDKGKYDSYITRLEYFADNLNPETLDKKMVRTSISNLWNMNFTKIIKGKIAETYTESTKKVAKETGYPNTTFPDSLAEHFAEVREKYTPKKEKTPSIIDYLKDLFTSEKEDKISANKIRVI